MKKPTVVPPLVIIGALFFIFGFITWLNGTLIPFLKLACELTYAQALLVTFAFYIAYVFLAIPSSLILQKTGFKNGMALGLVVMAGGALVFVPAAQARSFGLFLFGLFIQGAGLALLQTASNPYASILGPLDSAARRISIMGICNKVAGALSPVLIGAVVLKGATELEQQLAGANAATKAQLLQELANRVIGPYLAMAGVLLVLAYLVRRSSLPEISPRPAASAALAGEPASLGQFPHLQLGVLALFCAVGVEVIAGDTIIQYGRAQGISLDVARNFTSFTLIAMLVGYFVGVWAIPRYLSQQAALRLCAGVGVAFTLGIVGTHGYTSVLCVALLGLANSLMWPAIFPLSIRGLGAYTERGSALLIMGIGGGAVLPYLYGKASEPLGLQQAYLLLLPCYGYILFFALKGHAYPVKTPASYAVPVV
ncbi:glucose/galactose MFS transporter [Hymenobacter sp. UV11]|uniref:sugar MFS transporter n=1 Tax=Hymenobacter sp. UV11 TaxID=1849735 RepID=UPI00106060D9|nr:sugar MFS transporter [Hymenobacter sp. UV11]TDN38709.1 glucose/galactose MFS transporter [Hymenobacter sp. UV11]TFZ63468.1 glucose/galactose MFS transporter [Hymenobacter sp. UV11]